MIKFRFKNEPSGSSEEEPVVPSGQHMVSLTDYPQTHLLYHVHKNTAGYRNARPHNVIHASDLDPSRKWCPREPAILTRHNLKREKGFLSTAQQAVYNFGHAGADILIEMLPEGMVWGNWKCNACGHEHRHQYRPKKCYECGAKRRALRYNEVFMRDPELGIVGSCDLMVDLLGNGVKTLVEIKTEGNESFKRRNAAELEHEWRTKLYLYLADRTEWLEGKGINVEEARVVYLTKEGHVPCDKIKDWKLADWGRTFMKEYRTKRDDSFSEKAREAVLAYRTWRSAFEKGGNPKYPDRICFSPHDTRAKNCEVCDLCFKHNPTA